MCLVLHGMVKKDTLLAEYILKKKHGDIYWHVMINQDAVKPIRIGSLSVPTHASLHVH